MARLGGDELAVLQTDVADLEDTVALAERLIQVLKRPCSRAPVAAGRLDRSRRRSGDGPVRDSLDA